MQLKRDFDGINQIKSLPTSSEVFESVPVNAKGLRVAMAFAGHENFQSEYVRVIGRLSAPIENSCGSASFRVFRSS